MNNKIIVAFDFDGVIANSPILQIKIASKIIKQIKPSLDDINPEEALEIVREKGYLRLLREIKFPIMKIPQLLSTIKKEQYNNIKLIEIVKNMDTVLDRISRKFDTYILTGNSTDYIHPFLERYSLTNKFIKIFSDDTDRGKGKIFSDFRKEISINDGGSYYVGDEVPDIVNSRKIGMKCICSSWGITSKNRLLKEKPFAIAETPLDILKILGI